MQREDTKNMQKLIDLFLEEEGLLWGVQRIRVFEAWDEVVGERGAGVTIKKGYKGKTLWCTISSSMFRSQLLFQIDSIKKQMNSLLSEELVEKIILK